MCLPLSPPTWAWNPIHPAKCQRHKTATISFTLPARQQHSLPSVRTLLFKPFVAMAMDRPLCRATMPLCGTVLPSSVLRLQPLRAHRAACEGSQSWLKSNSSFSEKKILLPSGFWAATRDLQVVLGLFLRQAHGIYTDIWASLKYCGVLYERCV